MPINADDLAAFASSRAAQEKASANSVPEVELRAAVSRAYYAAFHLVLPLVDRMPPSRNCPRNSTYTSHEELTQRLHEWRTEGVHPRLARLTTTRNQLVNTIQAARAARVKADYRLQANCDGGEVVMQLSRWQRVKQVMEQLQNEMAKDAANDAAS